MLSILNLYLLKFGVLVRPSDELESIAVQNKVDAWFELMKKTGFDQKKIHNIVYKLKKQGKFKSVGKDVYLKG